LLDICILLRLDTVANDGGKVERVQSFTCVVVSLSKLRLSVVFGGAVGNLYCFICLGVTAIRSMLTEPPLAGASVVAAYVSFE